MKRLPILIAVFVLLAVQFLFVASPARADSFLIDFDGSNSGYTTGNAMTGSGNPGMAWTGTQYYTNAAGGNWHYGNGGGVTIPVAAFCSGGAVHVTNVSYDAFAGNVGSAASSETTVLRADGSGDHPVYRLDSKRNYWVAVSLNVNVDNTDMVSVGAAILSDHSSDWAGEFVALDNIRITYSCAVVAAFSTNLDTGDAPLRVEFTDHSQGATAWQWDFGDGHMDFGQNVTYTFSNPASYTVTLTVSNGVDNDTATKVIFVNGDGLIGSAATYKPLTTADQDPYWGQYDMVAANELDLAHDRLPYTNIGMPNDYPVWAWSNHNDADVHAVGAGTVISIDEPGPANCSSDLNQLGAIQLPAQAPVCDFIIPASIIEAADQGYQYFIYRLDLESLYRVKVRASGGQTITYLVDSPRVRINDAVTAGCIIGQTVKVFNLAGLELDGFWANIGTALDATLPFKTITDPIAKGVTILIPFLTDETYNTPQRLLPLLVLEPDSLTPCNVDPNHATCQPGANMRNPDEWDWSPGVSWTQNYPPTLNPSAFVSQKNQVKEGQLYSFNVNVQTIMPPATVQLWLGTQVYPFTISQGVQTIQIPAIVPTPDQGLFTSWGITNTGSVAVTILDGCLSEGGSPPATNSCKFENPSFDQGLGNWSYSSDVTTDGTGQVLVHNGSTLNQIMTLYPSGAEPYMYQIQILAVPAGTSWVGDASSTFGFSWEYPTGGDSNDFLAPDASTAWVVGNSNIPVTQVGIGFSATVPISQVTNGLFTLYVHTSETGAWHDGVWIRQICVINTFDDGTGGGTGLPYHSICDVVSAPDGEALSQWTFFLSASLDNFNRCTLMPQLQQMLSAINEIPKFLRWQMLYWQSVLIMLVNWFGGQFIPWLGGHFYNIAAGHVTTVTNNGGGASTSIWDVLYTLLGGNGSSNLWDVLTSLINSVLGPFTATILSILTQTANLLFFLLTSVLSIILAIITRLFELIWQLLSMLGGLVDAWNNAEPTLPDGVPNCTTYTESAFCVAIWVLNNILSLGPGPIFVAVVVGLGSLNILVFAIDKVRDIISSVTEAT